MKTVFSLLALVWLFVSCAFVESAFELNFGQGKIPLLSFSLSFPKPENLDVINELKQRGIKGLPDSLEGATLAHVQGLLSVTGNCYDTADVDFEQDEPSLDNKGEVQFVSCRPGGACSGMCGDLPFGLIVKSKFHLRLINEQQAKELQQLMENITPDSILQVRLRFFVLEPFQTTANGTDPIIDYLQYLSVDAADQEGNTIRVVDPWAVPMISEQTPQRFDLDIHSPLVTGIKRQLLNGEPVSLTFVMTLAIPEQNLYRIDLFKTGIKVVAQPEFVINALKAAQSQL